ncbi:MAG TPA: DUF3891 family protein [Symbiobacteriaceae bacterium]|nr:DUF3891 family protein [Symbiobacteriaceae bacterium]
MIIRSAAGRLRLINQADHAQVAGQFAECWGHGAFRAPDPLEPVRLATAIHDAGWQEWDEQPRLRPETQRPYDFIHIPSDDHVDIYERSVNAALDGHPYAGLLVSMHGTGFYKKRYGHMPKLEFREVLPHLQCVVDGFLDRQKRLQEELIALLEPDMDVLWTHYRWLQGWDALAVYLGLDDPQDRRTYSLGVMPHYPGGPEEELFLTGVAAGLYTVSSWPFHCRQIDVILPVRYVADRPYSSQEEFLEAFGAAPTEPLKLTILPA